MLECHYDSEHYVEYAQVEDEWKLVHDRIRHPSEEVQPETQLAAAEKPMIKKKKVKSLRWLHEKKSDGGKIIIVIKDQHIKFTRAYTHKLDGPNQDKAIR